MPELDRFYRERGDEAAVLIAAPTRSEAGIRDLLISGPYSVPVMLDDGVVAREYGVRYVPALFVIDAQGNLVDTIVGGVDFERLGQFVDDLD